jgi:predicted dehydrogenase
MDSGAPSIVIVGAGLMGRWHLDAARKSGARVVAVVDRDANRARAVGGQTLARDTLRAALQQPIDVVHICTPVNTHVALCQEALAAGCHVLVEKPATPTAAEATVLEATAREAERMLVPVHQFLFQRGVQAIRRRIAEIGPIRHLEFATASAGADRGDVDRDALAADILPHALSLTRNLLGVQVASLEWQLHRIAPGEWRANTATPAGCSIAALISSRARPTFAALRVLGERGSAAADLFHGFAMFETGTASRQYKVIRPLAVGLATLGAASRNLVARGLRQEMAYPGLRGLCAATYAAAKGHGPPPFDMDELRDVARTRDRLIELASAGGGVARPSPAA